MALTRAFDVEPAFFSRDRDAGTITELTSLYPDLPHDQLADLTARYPAVAASLLERAHRNRGPERNPYERVRDFFFRARNYVHKLDTAAE